MGELRRIPGIGAVGERDLLELGYTTIQSLAGADPEEMYARECARKGVRVDRCVLYVYRCAVYYASTAAGPGEAEVVGRGKMEEEKQWTSM